MSEGQSWVPDGDPCPWHPAEESRLLWTPGVGFISQCHLCREEFWAWRAANLEEVVERVELHPKKEPAQLSLQKKG